jgi:hypothetical protein
MTNPVNCSKCNIFLGNLYFLNSKINSTPTNIPFRKNKVFYIADDKTQYSYAYCQKCWPNNVINNQLIKQKTDPVIEANYALYLNEYNENVQNKKDLTKSMQHIGSLHEEITDLKDKLFEETNKHHISVSKYTDELEHLENTVATLKLKNSKVNDTLDSLYEEIELLEDEINVKDDTNECLENCVKILESNFAEEQKKNKNLNINVEEMKKKLCDLNMIHFNYVNVIKNLEQKITDFKKIIDMQENKIVGISNANRINGIIMKNEHEHNKTKIFKLQNYLNELNDFVAENMTSNIKVQQLEHNLYISNDIKCNLLKELEQQRQQNITLEYTISDLCEIINNNEEQQLSSDNDRYYNYDLLQNTLHYEPNFVDEDETSENVIVTDDDTYTESNFVDDEHKLKESHDEIFVKVNEGDVIINFDDTEENNFTDEISNHFVIDIEPPLPELQKTHQNNIPQTETKNQFYMEKLRNEYVTKLSFQRKYEIIDDYL